MGKSLLQVKAKLFYNPAAPSFFRLAHHEIMPDTPIESQFFRIDLDGRFDLGGMIATLDFRKPGSIARVYSKIFDSDYTGVLVRNICHDSKLATRRWIMLKLTYLNLTY